MLIPTLGEDSLILYELVDMLSIDFESQPHTPPETNSQSHWKIGDPSPWGWPPIFQGDKLAVSCFFVFFSGGVQQKQLRS